MTTLLNTNINTMKKNNTDWRKAFKDADQEFTESTYGQMTDKEINQQIGAILGGEITGQKHVESGHIYTLNYTNRRPGQRSEAAKKAGDKNVETGWINEFQKIGTDAAAEANTNKRLSKHPEFLALLPDTGITKQMAKNAAVDIGYAERQWDRLLTNTCEIENQVFLKNGRTNWELSTWKKKQ